MGLNDPQWGRKKGNSGPPDLDQLWRNFNKKLNNLLNERCGRSGSAVKVAAIIPGAIASVIGLLLGCFCDVDSQRI